MDTFGIIGFVFGVFGLLAYLSVSPLKRRVGKLEEALSAMEGTAYHEERSSLEKAVSDYIGKQVIIEFKEDLGDIDISYYGNSKHGSNTVVDADRGWLRVHVETPKGNKDKLIRMESIQRISEKS